MEEWVLTEYVLLRRGPVFEMKGFSKSLLQLVVGIDNV
jgi:hypothetical protein